MVGDALLILGLKEGALLGLGDGKLLGIGVVFADGVIEELLALVERTT